MQALSALGQPTQAWRAYHQLERRLEEELDTKPSAALQLLAEQLRQRGVSQASPPSPDGALPAQQVFDLAGASRVRAAPPEPDQATAVVPSAPRGRLVGAEFLRRTTTRFIDRTEEIERLGRILSTPRTRL